jgi:large conductance mechanosensitive channel
MPLISLIMPGEQGYVAWKWFINGKEIPYGLFIGEIVNFLIIALACIFLLSNFLGMVMKSKQEEPPPEPTKDQELLMEIRDLLKNK